MRGTRTNSGTVTTTASEGNGSIGLRSTLRDRATVDVLNVLTTEMNQAVNAFL